MAEITQKILSNQLPLIRVATPGTRVVTSMLAFPAGARFELPEENGIAHFLEHLVFKGGQKFSTPRSINYRAEELGASINAFTSHDFVAFHITSSAESAEDALDLLTDIVARPLIPADELERERGVIIQEISRYNDQPSSVANYLVDAAAYGDHPLGRTILGPEEHIQSFSKQQVLDFRERTWSTAGGAAVIAGATDNLDSGRVEELLSRFQCSGSGAAAEFAPPLKPDSLVERRDSAQSHLCLQWRPEAVDVSNPEQRTAFAVYSTVLGGSMGSRLFEQLREKRGLCYSINSSNFSHSDVAELNISGGLASDHLQEAHQRILDIVTDLRDNGPTAEEVDRAKAYLVGSTICALEQASYLARTVTRQKLVYNQMPDPDEIIDRLKKLTHQDIREIAATITGDPALGLVGPHDAKDFE